MSPKIREHDVTDCECLSRPLGMNCTHLQPNAAIDAGLKDRIATPYVWEEATESLRAISLIQAPEAYVYSQFPTRSMLNPP